MTNPPSIPTVALYPQQSARLRLFALWYFTTLMTVWNIAGHTVLGFEQSWAHPIVAVTAACVTQILLEWVEAWRLKRKPRFLGSVGAFLNFLPPAIISGFACAMLLYPNQQLMPTVFASILSIASKVLFRVTLPNGGKAHIFNPSNFGIIVTLFLFPWVGQAPPYQFTENITGFWHWALPGFILVTGVIVHGYATGRLTLCISWIAAFVAQGVFRAWMGNNAFYVPLMPMSSAAFILFTLYMVPDPATTPIAKPRQILFGVSVAFVYGALQMLHIVYGLFIALVFCCALRGLAITILSWSKQTKPSRVLELGVGPKPRLEVSPAR